MTSYVALLRGINVGTAKRVAMADLRQLMQDLGFSDVRTLLNSGNAVFESNKGTTATYAKAIESGINKRFGFSAPTIVLDEHQLLEIIKANPLLKVATDPARLLIAFVSSPSVFASVQELKAANFAPEQVVIGKQAAYLWLPEGVAESELAKAFDRITNKATTLRNWTTVLKIQANVGNH